MKRIFQMVPETQCQVILHPHSPHSSKRGAFRPVSCSFLYLNPTQKSLSFMNCQGRLASKLQNRVQLFSSPGTMQKSIWHCPSLGCSQRDLSFCVGKRQSTSDAIQDTALRKLQMRGQHKMNCVIACFLIIIKTSSYITSL